MIKNAAKGGASVQRTFRTNVEGFSWSPDGKTLCFTEVRGNHHGVYLVDANQGTVVRQISNGTDNDFGGVISTDGNTIYFIVARAMLSYSLWSYDRKTNLFSNYSRGMTACLIPNNYDAIYCARFTTNKESEIWRVNFKTGVEEVILSQPGKSFSTPQLSPDGKWLLVTGSSKSEKEKLTIRTSSWFAPMVPSLLSLLTILVTTCRQYGPQTEKYFLPFSARLGRKEL